MTTQDETNWAEKIGKPSLDGIREMVAALECDYDQLEELRDERDGWNPVEMDDPTGPLTWAEANPDDAEELAELEKAAGECESREDAEQRIQEDALSVEVRSDWVTPGSEPTWGEFQILLTTGGPAVRIMGELDEHGEPCRAWLEVQDWFKPWTEYIKPGASDVLLSYAQCFCFNA